MNRSSALAWGRGDRRRIPVTGFPAEVLALVDERQGGRFCVACRAANLETPKSEPIELDHRQPISKGGDNNHINLQWLCRGHNRGRGNRRDAPERPTWARRRPRGGSR